MTDDAYIERYYSPDQIAAKMNLSRQAILRLVRNEPGVVTIVEHGLMRDWATYRIPESTWNRVYERLVVKVDYHNRKK